MTADKAEAYRSGLKELLLCKRWPTNGMAIQNKSGKKLKNF
jgi:hypothetical protein